ncbi:hypothetical protein NLG97_g3177 [Lecanicillium saksenae]|uniref:Uncharacterized protein n=1 Tax=Lecanicillium saksenae TaxID=468837 RepID=A0ACC1QZ03_9HYPO|nr:hypothetical protein NLG97_g3177 [Lecanicillium saksenae]
MWGRSLASRWPSCKLSKIPGGKKLARGIVYKVVCRRSVSMPRSATNSSQFSPKQVNMLFKAILAVAGLTGLCAAVPTSEVLPAYDFSKGFEIHHKVTDYFPNALGNVERWDVAAAYHNYNETMEQWLKSIDPHTASSDEEKAEMIIAVSYAKPFDYNDIDMTTEKEALLGAVAGETAEDLERRLERRFTQYIVSHAHVVVWHACKAFFDCVSGHSCQFTIDIGKAPRSHCENRGGQNCCISWSTYKVQAGFFSRTWTECDAEVNTKHTDSASCEGKSDSNGGDVCLSNRASGCT